MNTAGDTVGRGIALVPMADLTIEHTWNALGLSGTGSHTVRADGVRVSPDNVIGMDVATSGSMSSSVPPLYRTALVPILALTLAGPLLGMALGALDSFNRGFRGAGDDNSADTSVAARAAITGDIAAAGECALAAADATQAWALRSDMMPPEDQVKVKLDIATVARSTRGAVDDLLDVAGVRGLSTDSELARSWRDIAVGSRHGLLNHRRVSAEYAHLVLG